MKNILLKKHVQEQYSELNVNCSVTECHTSCGFYCMLINNIHEIKGSHLYAGMMAQSVQRLPDKHKDEDLGLMPRTHVEMSDVGLERWRSKE